VNSGYHCLFWFVWTASLASKVQENFLGIVAVKPEQPAIALSLNAPGLMTTGEAFMNSFFNEEMSEVSSLAQQSL